jgi:hypothetical protein
VSRNARFQLVLLAWIALGGRAAAEDSFPLHATNSIAHVLVAQGQDLLHAYLPDDERVAATFNLGLTRFTRTDSATAAWRSLVSTNDIVGIKVFSQPGPLTGTRPAVVAAIARGLLAAGLPPAHIIIWDKHAQDLRRAGFVKLGKSLGVRVAGAADAGFDTNTFYLPDSPVVGSLVWGDLEFGMKGEGIGKKSFVSKLVSRQMTKIISVAPLINQNEAGICGHFFSLCLGSVDNTRRFESDPDRLATALPEIYAMPIIGDRVVLNVTDSLIGQYQGGPAGYLQYSASLQQIWFSKDPVALDVLSLRELSRERKAVDVPPMFTNFEIYTNATFLQLGMDNPGQIQIEKVP